MSLDIACEEAPIDLHRSTSSDHLLLVLILLMRMLLLLHGHARLPPLLTRVALHEVVRVRRNRVPILRACGSCRWYELLLTTSGRIRVVAHAPVVGM